MQGGAPVALGLARADDDQHLGPVQRQQTDRGAGACAQRLERLDVLADLVGHLTAGQRGVPEEQHWLVAVALERTDQQMPVVGGIAQQLVTHAGKTRTCYKTSPGPPTYWLRPATELPFGRTRCPAETPPFRARAGPPASPLVQADSASPTAPLRPSTRR